MADLILNCGTDDLVVDASLSSIAMVSGSSIAFNAATLFSVVGAVKLAAFGAGIASFDASGNMSSVAGEVFDVNAPYSVTAAWSFGSTVGITGAATLSSTLGVTGAVTLSSTLGVTGETTLSSTLGVSGTATLSGVLINSGITTVAGVLAIPTSGPPAGYSYVLAKNDTKQFYRMT